MEEPFPSAFEEALSHLERNDVSATRNALEALLLETPDSVEARLALAVLLAEGGERSAARRHFVVAYELLVDDSRPLAESIRARTLVYLCALALEEGDWKEVLLREGDFERLKNALAQQGLVEEAARLLLVAGSQAARGRAYAEARQLTARAAAVDSTFAAAWFNLAALAQHAGALTDAQTFARRAIQEDESFAEAYFLLGTLLVDSSPEESLALIEHALRLKPDEIEWRLALATALARRGDYEGARIAYARVLGMDASRADAHLGFAVASRALGDLESARYALRRAFELNPSLAEAVQRMILASEVSPPDS